MGRLKKCIDAEQKMFIHEADIAETGSSLSEAAKARIEKELEAAEVVEKDLEEFDDSHCLYLPEGSAEADHRTESPSQPAIHEEVDVSPIQGVRLGFERCENRGDEARTRQSLPPPRPRGDRSSQGAFADNLSPGSLVAAPSFRKVRSRPDLPVARRARATGWGGGFSGRLEPVSRCAGAWSSRAGSPRPTRTCRADQDRSSGIGSFRSS